MILLLPPFRLKKFIHAPLLQNSAFSLSVLLLFAPAVAAEIDRSGYHHDCEVRIQEGAGELTVTWPISGAIQGQIKLDLSGISRWFANWRLASLESLPGRF